MSIESEITRISSAVSDISQAISDMGGDVSDVTSIDDLSSSVLTIPSSDPDLEETCFERYYSLVNSVTTITNDSSGIPETIVMVSDEATVTTTFVRADTTVTTTMVVVPTEGLYDYTNTTVIEKTSTGKTITSSFVKTEKT